MRIPILNRPFGLDASLVGDSLTNSNPKYALYYNDGNWYFYNLLKKKGNTILWHKGQKKWNLNV